MNQKLEKNKLSKLSKIENSSQGIDDFFKSVGALNRTLSKCISKVCRNFTFLDFSQHLIYAILKSQTPLVK